jgi:hypothetical protein
MPAAERDSSQSFRISEQASDKPRGRKPRGKNQIFQGYGDYAISMVLIYSFEL